MRLLLTDVFVELLFSVVDCPLYRGCDALMQRVMADTLSILFDSGDGNILDSAKADTLDLCNLDAAVRDKRSKHRRRTSIVIFYVHNNRVYGVSDMDIMDQYSLIICCICNRAEL